MTSNQCPTSHRPPHHSLLYSTPGKEEVTLKRDEIKIERKTFVLTLKDNQRGRCLRITEQGHSRRQTIIIPASGLEELKRRLDDMVRASSELPVV